jgi:hypothetical protein
LVAYQVVGEGPRDLYDCSGNCLPHRTGMGRSILHAECVTSSGQMRPLRGQTSNTSRISIVIAIAQGRPASSGAIGCKEGSPLWLRQPQARWTGRLIRSRREVPQRVRGFSAVDLGLGSDSVVHRAYKIQTLEVLRIFIWIDSSSGSTLLQWVSLRNLGSRRCSSHFGRDHRNARQRAGAPLAAHARKDRGE